MGKPKSVFQSFSDKQEKEEIKNNDNIVGGISDYFISLGNSFNFTGEIIEDKKIPDEDLTSEIESYVQEPEITTEPIFKNDETKIKNVSYQVTPLNFKVQSGRITGTVNISSSELTNEKPVLHASFYPLDLKQNKLSEKMNQLNFSKDLNETITINESSKNYENVSMNLHVMNPKTKEHLSQEVNIDVLKSDSQDMPVKDKKDNTSLYVVGGIGLIVLALIVKKMRKGNKN